MLWGVIVFYTLPDSIETAEFLDEKERQCAGDRVVFAGTGINLLIENQWKPAQVVECLLDAKTWFFFSISLLTQVKLHGPSFLECFTCKKLTAMLRRRMEAPKRSQILYSPASASAILNQPLWVSQHHLYPSLPSSSLVGWPQRKEIYQRYSLPSWRCLQSSEAL